MRPVRRRREVGVLANLPGLEDAIGRLAHQAFPHYECHQLLKEQYHLSLKMTAGGRCELSVVVAVFGRFLRR